MSISDLQSDMMMLELDMYHELDMSQMNYSYEFRMECLHNAAAVLEDLVYYEELIIKKKHCI